MTRRIQIHTTTLDLSKAVNGFGPSWSLGRRSHPSSPRLLNLLIFGLLLLLSGGQQAAAATPLTTVRVATGLSRPLFVVSPPGDTDRIFIVEQPGTIQIVSSGVLLPAPFLDIRSIVGGIESFSDERGLMGLVFDPDYATNGYFYVNYTDKSDDTRIERYQVSADPDIADVASAYPILSIAQPYTNHNGGWMDFGPDGYFYISSGDGGNREDPDNHAQTLTNDLLGKLLRIDVRGDDFPASADRNYRIPQTNPFVDQPGDDEIWAFGLRNPWRCAFDRQTGDLYIPDVGQDEREEINIQMAGAAGGLNYGWRCMEGDFCTELSGCSCDDASLTPPDFVYDHKAGCSITGGYVYRGCAIPDLSGTYFFADFCSDQIWSFRYEQGPTGETTNRTAELTFDGVPIEGISSFGEDASGELYLCAHREGDVYKIVPDVGPADCNSNGTPDGCDIVAGLSNDKNANGVPDACEAGVEIVSSDPPHGSIDARQPFEIDGSNPEGWQSIVLTIIGDAYGVLAEDLTIEQWGSELPWPQVVNVVPLDANRVVVTFDRALEPCTWTTISHRLSDASVGLGVLPGDANGDGFAGPVDILSLINSLNGVVQLPLWGTDINRSGKAEPADILRLIDILNRAGSFASIGKDCAVAP